MSEEKAVVIPPIHEIKCPIHRLRAVFTAHESLGGDIDIDKKGLAEAFDDWLYRGRPLVIYGMTMTLYEFPEVEADEPEVRTR